MGARVLGTLLVDVLGQEYNLAKDQRGLDREKRIPGWQYDTGKACRKSG